MYWLLHAEGTVGSMRTSLLIDPKHFEHPSKCKPAIRVQVYTPP